MVVYQIGPFFAELNFFPETNNKSRCCILKLFFSLHDSRFSCPATSLFHLKVRVFRVKYGKSTFYLLPNRCLLLLS